MVARCGWRSLLVFVIPVVLAALVAPSLAAAKARTGSLPVAERTELYRATLPTAQIEQLQQAGYDVIVRRGATGANGTKVNLVLNKGQVRKLAKQGIRTRLQRAKGKTSSQLSARQAQNGFKVWRSFSEPGGIEDQLYRIARENRDIVQLKTIGRTHQGKRILALKLTDDARKVRDGKRPSVLYSSTQHAREWITTETTMRLLRHYLANYGKDPEITRLVNSRELWFVPVANPDGYDFTFTPGNRLWRKNLRDNNGDGQIATGDGVDPNRNYATNWNYDQEGSSDDPSSETYRGPSAGSEPETRALDGLMRRVGFEFQVNYHSYGPLILYPLGFQVDTETADNPIYEALSGNDAKPAIEGYDPDLSAELYTTNGETIDHVHGKYGTLGWTVEENEGCAGCGFVFPDDEALVQKEFERNLPFALDVARSATRPDRPQSHLGNRAPAFDVDEFDVSYGDPQTVQTRARRSLGKVRMHYRINGGRERTSSTREWKGGERYGKGYDRWYQRLRGQVKGTRPGDRVRVWFEARGGERSKAFSYRAAQESSNKVLVLSAEDYTGASPDQTGGPKYLQQHLDALRASGIKADTYDVDARGRKAPDPLGVLSHYRAVLWYTGDDIIPRDKGGQPGTAAKVANDTQLGVRDYLNEGGKLLYAGKYAGFANANGYEYSPDGAQQCSADPDVEDGCLPLSNDFLQYYLGSYVYSDNNDPPAYPLTGIAKPFEGLTADFAPGADHTASHLVTSSFLPKETYPLFASYDSIDYQRPGGSPYDPKTGEWYMAANRGDGAYKRLTRTIDLTGKSAADLQFAVSYDTEPAYDALFVEAHTVGQDDWTTLPDANGHTSQTDTLDSCTIEWRDLHPFLDHYQTVQRGQDGGVTGCTPEGTTGEWNAASGNSGGYQDWKLDLADYAGKKVEVSITYATDFASQGLGVFVDDAKVTADGATVEQTSFEQGLDGWEVPGPPEGSPVSRETWERSQSAFQEGAAVNTADTIYLGFGLEQLATDRQRADVAGRAITHLLRSGR